MEEKQIYRDKNRGFHGHNYEDNIFPEVMPRILVDVN